MEPIQNFLVPKHRKLSSEEIDAILVKYSINSTLKLPKIKKADPALAELGAEAGDVIEITRNSYLNSSINYYRRVVE